MLKRLAGIFLVVVFALVAGSLSYGEEELPRQILDLHKSMEVGHTLMLAHTDLRAQFSGAVGEPKVTRLLVVGGHHGYIDVRPDAFVYTPEDGFKGTAVITYLMEDDEGALRGRILIEVYERTEE